jgi:trigger factor
LKIEKLIQDDHQAKLIVEVEPEQMETSKRRAARKLAERGKIPGFRPGKAPYTIIVHHFGEKTILEAAIDVLVDDIYPKVLEESGVNPAGAGSLESIDNPELPKLTFLVPLAPEVDLGDYHSVRLPYEWVAPGQKEVDAALEDLRQRYASTETVDREVQVGDYVLVDVKGSYAKPKEGDEDKSAGLSRTGFATFVRAEDRDTEWPYTGFNKELVGLKPGDSKTIKHKYPKDDSDENLRGETVNFEATVKTVRGVILPDLDDEFAKQVGAGETLDALMEAVKLDVENRSKSDYDDKYFVELIEKIKEGATIKYSQHTVEHESEHVLEDLQQRLAQQGMDLPTYFKMRSTTQEKFVEEEVHPVAKKRLERSLLLDEIIRIEKIEVDNSALDAEFNNTLNELQMQGVNLNEMRGGRKGQQKLAEAVAMESATRILTRRALDMIKTIATGEYVAPETADAAGETEPAEGAKKPRKKAASPKAKKEAGTASTEKKPAKKSAKKSE